MHQLNQKNPNERQQLPRNMNTRTSQIAASKQSTSPFKAHQQQQQQQTNRGICLHHPRHTNGVFFFTSNNRVATAYNRQLLQAAKRQHRQQQQQQQPLIEEPTYLATSSSPSCALHGNLSTTACSASGAQNGSCEIAQLSSVQPIPPAAAATDTKMFRSVGLRQPQIDHHGSTTTSQTNANTSNGLLFDDLMPTLHASPRRKCNNNQHLTNSTTGACEFPEEASPPFASNHIERQWNDNLPHSHDNSRHDAVNCRSHNDISSGTLLELNDAVNDIKSDDAVKLAVNSNQFSMPVENDGVLCEHPRQSSSSSILSRDNGISSFVENVMTQQLAAATNNNNAVDSAKSAAADSNNDVLCKKDDEKFNDSPPATTVTTATTAAAKEEARLCDEIQLSLQHLSMNAVATAAAASSASAAQRQQSASYHSSDNSAAAFTLLPKMSLSVTTAQPTQLSNSSSSSTTTAAERLPPVITSTSDAAAVLCPKKLFMPSLQQNNPTTTTTFIAASAANGLLNNDLTCFDPLSATKSPPSTQRQQQQATTKVSPFKMPSLKKSLSADNLMLTAGGVPNNAATEEGLIMQPSLEVAARLAAQQHQFGGGVDMYSQQRMHQYQYDATGNALPPSYCYAPPTHAPVVNQNNAAMHNVNSMSVLNGNVGGGMMTTSRSGIWATRPRQLPGFAALSSRTNTTNSGTAVAVTPIAPSLAASYHQQEQYTTKQQHHHHQMTNGGGGGGTLPPQRHHYPPTYGGSNAAGLPGFDNSVHNNHQSAANFYQQAQQQQQLQQQYYFQQQQQEHLSLRNSAAQQHQNAGGVLLQQYSQNNIPAAACTCYQCVASRLCNNGQQDACDDADSTSANNSTTLNHSQSVNHFGNSVALYSQQQQQANVKSSQPRTTTVSSSVIVPAAALPPPAVAHHPRNLNNAALSAADNRQHRRQNVKKKQKQRHGSNNKNSSTNVLYSAVAANTPTKHQQQNSNNRHHAASMMLGNGFVGGETGSFDNDDAYDNNNDEADEHHINNGGVAAESDNDNDDDDEEDEDNNVTNGNIEETPEPEDDVEYESRKLLLQQQQQSLSSVNESFAQQSAGGSARFVHGRQPHPYAATSTSNNHQQQHEIRRRPSTSSTLSSLSSTTSQTAPNHHHHHSNSNSTTTAAAAAAAAAAADVAAAAATAATANNLRDGAAVVMHAAYLGSTHLFCESRVSRQTRLAQCQEALTRIKAPEGESQPMIDVDICISIEKVSIVNTDSNQLLMEHALRTISYTADMGDLVVLMVKRGLEDLPPVDTSSTNPTSASSATATSQQPKMLCHVFQSATAPGIAQCVGQAFQVAYVEFLKANGVQDERYLRMLDYQEVLASQEMANDELDAFATRERQKDVIIPKQKQEPLGIVVVESGWGSLVPTVVVANIAPGGAAGRTGKLNIGDQILNVDGVSCVGLPLKKCQQLIKDTRANKLAVKMTVVPTSPVVSVRIRRPDTRYQLGFSVQNGIICSLLRGGIAERGGIRVGHRIIEINGQSVVSTSHEQIVNMLAHSVGDILIKTMPTSIYRLLIGQEQPLYI